MVVDAVVDMLIQGKKTMDTDGSAASRNCQPPFSTISCQTNTSAPPKSTGRKLLASSIRRDPGMQGHFLGTSENVILFPILRT